MGLQNGGHDILVVVSSGSTVFGKAMRKAISSIFEY